MPKYAFLLFALAFSALSSTTASTKSVERHFQKSFDVARGAILELNHGDGNVTIEPWSESRIDVTVDYKASISGVFTTNIDFTVDFEQTGDRVRVTGRPASASGLIVNMHSVRYTYVIKAPAWTEIRTAGDDGKVEIAGWRANLDLKLDDGSLRVSDVDAKSVTIRMQDGEASLEKISGALDIHCDDGTIGIIDSKIASGSIEIQDGGLTVTDSEGDFRIKMDDGNATLNDVRSRLLDIRGQDGHARARLLGVTDPDFTIVMDDGNIDVSIPDDLSAAFEAQVDDGTVDMKLVGAEDVKKSRHNVRGILNGGHGRIHLETADGTIELYQAR